MKKYIVFIFLSITVISVFSQGKREQYLGIDVLQLTTSTVNLNYSIDINHVFTPVIGLGYTINYARYGFDIVDVLFSINNKDNTYEMNNQSGVYLKLGSYFNFRKNIEKRSFFHVGMFLTASYVLENGYYEWEPTDIRFSNSNGLSIIYIEPIEYRQLLFGINTLIGYEFNLSKRLKLDVDYQLSFLLNEKSRSYEYRNFIPGMGSKYSESILAPALILNLKYRL